jgi:hypothetical protein
MPGKPYQSSLIPYQNEINALRSRRPPVSYAQIAVLLREKHELSIQRAAIAKFVKARSGGRKVYFFRKEVAAKKGVLVKPEAQPTQKNLPPPVVKSSPKPEPAKPPFEFTYSERYNLHRLPPEEAAERRKELEKHGH